MVEVLVEFDYAAQEPDELNIKKGDIIKDVVQKPGGWWEGTLREKKGVFPDNFVKVLEKDPVILRNKKDTKTRQCKVIFSYNQDHEDELNLKVGDIINIVGEEEEGWWRGVLNGVEGVFPSNFVEEIAVVQPRPKPSTREETLKSNEPAPALPAKPVKQQCEARFSYKAQNNDELSLKEGDVVNILNKDGQDPGWWKGELNGKIGVFPDNFVTLLNIDDKASTSNKLETGKSPADPSAIKPSSVALQRKSLEVKNAQAQVDNKITPPLPGKKPSMPVKKSPSGSFLGKWLQKDKAADVPDGGNISRPKIEAGKEVKESNVPEGTSTNTFDQIERRPLLRDVRAERARAPGRRLPTSVYKDDEEEIPGLLNGNADHTKSEHSAKSEDSFKSEGSASSENLDASDLDVNEVKPKLREWEKHKAPWLEEMKLNQAKRTSVSPVPDNKQKAPPPPVTDPKPDAPEPSKSHQNSPADKEVKLTDMSKSMTDMKLSPMELKPIPKPYKTPPNELDKAPPIKSKPVLPSLNRHSIGSTPRESPSRSQILPQSAMKVSPKIKPDQYENVTPQKAGSTTVNSSSSSNFSSSINNSSSSFSHVVEKSSVSSSSQSFTTADLSNLSNLSKFDSGISVIKFNEVLDRLTKLEAKCEQQGQMIKELKNRLQVETEMRMMLQEKIMHNNVQV